MWSVKHLYILIRKYPTQVKLSEVTEDQIGFSQSWSRIPRILWKISFGYANLMMEGNFN